MPKNLTRRDFLKLLWAGMIDSFLLAVGGIWYGMLVEPASFKVENIRLQLPRLPQAFSGLRVAQLSDIHMGGWMDRERFQDVADLVVAQKPDILLITGDFLIGHYYKNSSVQALDDLTAVLSPLAKSIPSFAILGNHDYWTNADAVRQMLSSSGIMDLTNSVFTLKNNGNRLHFCGVDDVWEGSPRLGLIADQLPDGDAAILLAHEPDFADKSVKTGKFDLQLSGHTHGGQVVLPFLGPPILPHLGRKYPSGLYRVGNMYQYTNRGVGMAKLPIRLNCPPEITIFQLEDAG
jgi:predicted MPP superfamily phosphohydrolase